MKRIARLLTLLMPLACAAAASDAPGTPPTPGAPAASHTLWLEDTGSPRTQAWLAARRDETHRAFESDPRFGAEQRRFLGGAGRQHNEHYLNGGLVHRLQTSAQQPLGRWQVRATTAAGQRLLGQGWQTLLDLDALARREGKRWTLPLWWMNPACDLTRSKRCIVQLSPDGGDRTVLREFDLPSRRFLPHGFAIEVPARHYAHWIDADRLLLASDFGPGSMSPSQYARQARVWERGTSPEQARLLFDAGPDAVLYIPHNFSSRTRTLFMAEVWHEGQETPSWWTLPMDGPPRRFEAPAALVRYRGLMGVVGDRLLALTAEAFELGERRLPAGTLLALPLPGAAGSPEPVFIPAPNEAIDPVFHLAVGDGALWFGVMRDVSARLVRATPGASGWQLLEQPLPPHASLRLSTGESAPSSVLITLESLLTPPRTELLSGGNRQVLEAMPAAFDASRHVTEQHMAISRDGTRVPYYLVRPRHGTARAPALISAYGGFGVSWLPTYLNNEFHSDLLAPMLRAGGAYVSANIRGGGEYGPSWAAGARGRLRHKGVEDLIAVAEDLARHPAVDARRLAFVGSSNGGLLASVLAVQRPDLWRAVLADVPLTDMLRFHELYTGAVWISEYGDPRVAQDRAALAALSPLQGVKPGVRYPPMLVSTSSADDRVHPGHARRLVEALRDVGAPVWLHESAQGGHGGAASRDATARLRALQTIFLLQQLGLR